MVTRAQKGASEGGNAQGKGGHLEARFLCLSGYGRLEDAEGGRLRGHPKEGIGGGLREARAVHREEESGGGTPRRLIRDAAKRLLPAPVFNLARNFYCVLTDIGDRIRGRRDALTPSSPSASST